MQKSYFLLPLLFLVPSFCRAEETVVAEASSTNSYAYADEWQEGRGFDVGDTVPDIPLVDLDGGEVRFSEFLGKRYVLYCWASW